MASNMLGLNWLVTQGSVNFASKNTYRGDISVFSITRQFIF